MLKASFCGGKFLCVFHSIGVFIFPCSPSKNFENMSIWNISNFNWRFVLTSVSYAYVPHWAHVWKLEFSGILELNWLGLWSHSHVWKKWCVPTPKDSLQGFLSIPTHTFTTCVQINHFFDYWCDPSWHHGKNNL